MTGRRSPFLSIALVASCYAEPDLEITVIRTDAVNISIEVCRDGHCKGGDVFPAGPETQRSVFVFVDDDIADVMLVLDRNSPSFHGCVAIELGGERLQRTLTIGATATATLWSCADGVTCETIEMCP
jgi:hypothetical protein